MTNYLFGNQSIIVSLDIDSFLFDRLNQISKAGFNTVEINTCDAELLKKIIQEFPSLNVGAGNIINIPQLEQSYHAGVHFVSSPGLLPALVQTAAIYSINYFPGIATLSEAMQVLALGCYQARPYPANLSFCVLLNKSLPMLRLYPAEIEWDEAEHYLILPSVEAVSILNPESKQLSPFFAETKE